ncbi:unnamed protein product [Lymnaea stagnalis]|uniref:MARVEL domain-containing protein n=1 Tax=Lymnaea stagnalis TaxID=6523 RepID=A0AAV2IKA1_LYMST
MGVADALNANTVLLLRLIIYGLLVFFSFFIFVGVAVMKDEVNGLCPLYHFGAVSNCNYPMAIAIIFQLFYILYRIVIILLLKLGKLNTEMFLLSDIMELIYTCIDAVTLLFTFIGACILSAGHNDTCGDSSMFCTNWVSASRAAQAGAWISIILWLFLVIVEFIYLFRSGKIPFLGGGVVTRTTTTSQQGGGASPVDTPSYIPDDSGPKY